MASQRGVKKSGPSFSFVSRDVSEPSHKSKMELFAKLDIRYLTAF